MLLPLYEFALNSARFASTKELPAFVVFDHEPNLDLEVTVCDVTDSPV